MSKKAWIVLLFLLLLGGGMLWFFWWREGPVKNFPSTKNGPILFFGDSLVEGVGASQGHDLPSLVAQGIGVPVLNYGVAGDTTRLVLGRLDQALSENPKLVLILLGGNDFLQKVPRAETFSNLKQIVLAFQNEGAMVVVLGVRSGLLSGGADTEYETLAKDTQSAYISDVLKGVFANAGLMSDSLHPNDRGYAIMAERIIPVVKKLLQP